MHNKCDEKQHKISISPNMYIYPGKFINQMIQMLTSQTTGWSFELCEAPISETASELSHTEG